MNSILGVLKLIVAYAVLIPQILNPIFFIPALQKSSFEKWTPKQEYTQDYAVELQKDADKDFVVLNLADVQLHDLEYFFGNGEYAENMILKLVEDQKPDLITLSGDNSWGMVTHIKLIEFIDSLGIPWAPVMGNHDGERCVSEYWCAKLYSDAKNCLFKFGPEDMGYGNYIINITENSKIIHTLYMMDTHSNTDYTLPDGTTDDGYDHLWDNQLEWYSWAVKGIEGIAGKPVESTVIIHIPPYEMEEVYNTSYDFTNDCITGIYAENSYGVMHESPGAAPVNNGFLDLAKELDSTKNILFGHDHINNASVLIDGIRLTYGLKLGYACYYEDGMMGGTILTIDSFGKGTVEHHYYG